MTWSDEMREIIRKEAPKPGQRFTIEDVYAYEEEQATRHPNNKHVRETLRDKLQEFRDLGLIEFVDEEGGYRRLFEDRDTVPTNITNRGNARRRSVSADAN